MQDTATPALIDVPAQMNITDLLEQQRSGDPDNVIFTRRGASGEWEDVSAAEFHADVQALAKGLISRGITPGARVGIMSATRFEWSLLDFALWYAGAVSVPIYETSSASQIAWIAEDSELSLVFAETAQHAQTVREGLEGSGIGSTPPVLLIEGNDIRELRESGRDIDDDEVEVRRAAANTDDLATIIYTSGVTGRPKGCELTHGNFVHHSLQTIADLDGVISKTSSTVLFLPMAHVFARFVSVIFIAAGGRVAHTPDIKQLIDDLGDIRPTFLLGVPRVFEKIYNSAALKAEGDGRRRIFQAAVDTAVAWSQATTDGTVPWTLRLRHAVFSRLVYSKLRARMGGLVTHAFSGGSPLGDRLAHFFNGVGIQIIEGYGLTETTAPVTGNLPAHYRIGTVGRPLPGNAVRLAEDGEVLVRGTCLFRGYRNRPDLNAESFTADGWFYTGDLGRLDEEGRLIITGRKKEILVTAGGKNVAPAQLEDAIRSDLLVSQAVVVGDGRPFISAMITLDGDVAPSWLRSQGLDPRTPMKELTEHPQVLAHLQKVIDSTNSTVSKAESIRSFTVLEDDFTIGSGHLTPSLKIKRAEVMRDFQRVVENLYDKAAHRARRR
ncbi:AMP-dependent synthetase/ligase [Nesterenkonia lutea]|uniref:Acyl-CoA synthetase n=1 Tax=Nesterenkonia lutea TaxID=272919 RepID=A0ABR9JDB8_9MICC|nr:AMP-dependent synthetase/ligase [Nesterenkonia lutea]MBE1523922.1 long-chain acyl-CoA synthetase [Nesterenkonia lutea]